MTVFNVSGLNFNCIKIAEYEHCRTQICMNCKFQVTIANLRKWKIGFSCKLLEARAFLGLNVRNFRLFLTLNFFSLSRVGLELRFKKVQSILDKDKFFEMNFIGSVFRRSENFLAQLTEFFKKCFRIPKWLKICQGPNLTYSTIWGQIQASEKVVDSLFSDVDRKSVIISRLFIFLLVAKKTRG